MTRPQGATTFGKGLAVLACFESGRRDLTMAELARLTGFDRATTRRLCLTLIEAGYLSQAGKTLCLTPKIMAIAGGYLASHDFGTRVQPVLNASAEELGGEVALAVLDGDRALYVARSATPAARLSLGFSVGSRVPLLPTALGRALLSQVPDARREAVLAAHAATRFTPATECAPDRLRQSIAEAATQGYAYACDGFEMGAAGLAVPVAPLGAVPAVVSTTAATSRLESHAARAHALDILRRTAMALR